MSSKSGSGRMQMERRPSAESEPHIVDDPITVGPDRSISVDLSKLRAPTNSYDADVCWIVRYPGTVSLFFGKRNLNALSGRDDEPELRTRLEIRYSPESFVNHFWRNSESFYRRLRKYTAVWPSDAKTATADAPHKWRAAKDHSEWVNLEAMAHAGTEATIDFYQLPAPGVARFHQGKGSRGLSLVAIVRVQLSVFDLVRLFDEAEPVVNEIRDYLGKIEPEVKRLQQEEAGDERAHR